MKKTSGIFQCRRNNKKVAEMIANCANADLIEITPKTPYTERDLNWMDKKSRSSIEMSDKTYRPELLDIDIDMNTYHEIILDSHLVVCCTDNRTYILGKI